MVTTRPRDARLELSSRSCPRAWRILHVLDHSWPVLDGYSQRSRSLVAAQMSLGHTPNVLTGPLHQQDDPTASDTSYDGVPYFRTAIPEGIGQRSIQGRWPLFRELNVIRLLQRRLEALLDSRAFDIVHAHSPSLCGLAAQRAAAKRGLPFVYEIRSFWEDSDLNVVRSLGGSLRYRMSRGLETHVLKNADVIVGISHAILKDVSGRGIPADRLFHVPNGVDIDRFVPRPRDPQLTEPLCPKGVPTLGYLGTFFPWEGVPWLVRAAAELHRAGHMFRLLLVGDGADRPEIERAISELGVSDYVHYFGRVPHERVSDYYAAMDVLVYPRLRTRITEFVTPLKPLEAMAQGKAVLGSDVGGIRELIDHGETGLLFRAGDIGDFVVWTAKLLNDPSLRACLGENARKKVTIERSWEKIAQTYESAYEAAVLHSRGKW
jgi:PEP-CTERM/exosortase A-associated glycosyltransferase